MVIRIYFPGILLFFQDNITLAAFLPFCLPWCSTGGWNRRNFYRRMPKRPVVFHPVVRKDFITFFAGNLNCPIGGTVCRRIYRFSRTMLYRQCCFIAVAFLGFCAAFPLAGEFLNAGCIAVWLFCNFAIIIPMPQSRPRYFDFPFGIPAYRADDPFPGCVQVAAVVAGCSGKECLPVALIVSV